nr:glycosyltransferase [uncultured Butyrivibrio sp.]
MNIVIVDCFDTWEHRVDLLHKVLKEEGHSVKCFLSDYRHFEKVYRMDKKQDFIFFHAKLYKKNISMDRLISHIKLSKAIFSYIDEHSKNIDLLWVLAPPNVFIRDAANIKRKHQNIKLIFDLIDLWPETMPVGKIKTLLFPWKDFRDKYIASADVVVTECNLYKKVLGKVLDGKRVETLYLAREDKGYNPYLNLPEDKISLCYLGSINNIIDIDGIVKVVEAFQEKKGAVLHIVGDGEKKNELLSKVKGTGAEVVDHGKVFDRTEKQKIFDSCHYGLNMMKDTVCVGLTMKSIDYFEFGLPIINNIKGDTSEIIEKYECGINSDLNVISKINALSSEKYRNMRVQCRNFYSIALSETVFKHKIQEIIG